MDAVRTGLLHAFATGRPAQAYLIVGPVRTVGSELAEWIGRQLIGDEPTIGEHAHPDMPWFKPEKKSRIISVEMMREQILPMAQQSALCGGWKVPVIVSADRLKAEAANAFLKTLEEPPPKTLFLLLADAMTDLLPTIVSRCQVLHLEGRRRLDDPWRGQVLGLLAGITSKSVLQDTARADALCAILDEMNRTAEKQVREEAKENSAVLEDKEVLDALVGARAKAWRSDLLLTIEQWMGDLVRLAASAGSPEPPRLSFPTYAEVLAARAKVYPLAKLLENLTMLEQLSIQLERNIAPAQILPYWLDRFFL